MDGNGITSRILVSPKLPRRTRGLLGCIAALFFIKACCFALFVTHLWDIPDEPGHFSYVADLADGHYPVIGKSHMTPEVMKSWKGWPSTNWIAQHPPLYYALDVPVLWIARASGMSPEQQFRVVRLPSALYGALAVFAAGLVGFRVTRSSMAGIATALILAGTPMFLHMSSGTSHDTLLAMLCMFSAYFLFEFLDAGQIKALFVCGVFAGLASITKVTALAMAIPVFLVACFHLFEGRKDIASWVRKSFAVWVTFFALPVMMMFVNFYIYRRIFPSASSIAFAGAPHVPIGYLEYLLNYPIFQHVIINYFGLIGWTGMGQGSVKLLLISGDYLSYYVYGLVAALLILISERWLAAFGYGGERRWRLLAPLVAFGTASVVVFGMGRPEQLSVAAALVFAASVLVLLVPLSGWHRCSEALNRIYIISAVTILFFSLAYYTEIQTSFIGQMRAVHGRYFYPVLPFFYAMIMRSLTKLRVEWVAFLFGLGSLIVCDWFFLRQVFPFYGII